MQLFAAGKALLLPQILTTQFKRIVKLTAILLTIICIHASAGGYSQAITLSAKNIRLEKVFTEIEKQTGYSFVYRWEVIQNSKPVSLQVNNASIKYVLDLCFQGQSLTYSIVDKVVVITTKDNSNVKKSMEPGEPGESLIDVSGRVVDENGKPVIATVAVKGTNKGTTTDANGFFTLKNVDENATLIISAVNIETYEVKVDGETDLAIINVKIKIAEGEEVKIVSTGYQDIPKERATGAFQKIDNEILNRRVGPDIISRLDGNSSILFDKRDPNNIKLQLRGLYTLTTSITQPLIVVDNFPYEGNLNDINPNDVESITLLKDASAASIWGAKAGNGVIVITTKKAKFNQKPAVSFHFNITTIKKPDLFDLPVISSPEYIELEKFLFSKGTFFSDTASNARPAFTPVYEILFRQRRGEISQAEADFQINALKGLDARNDFDKYIYRAAVNQQYAANLTGGTETINYLLSAGYDKNLFNLAGNDFERMTFRFYNTVVPIKKLQLRFGIFYTHTNSSGNSTGDYGTSFYNVGTKPLYPYAQIADANGNAMIINAKYRGSFTDTAGMGKLLDWKFRPLDDLRHNNRTSELSSLRADFDISYSIMNGFSVSLAYQYQKNNTTARKQDSEELFSTRDLINRYTNLNATNASDRYPIPLGGILDLTDGKTSIHSARGQVNFNRTFANKHNLIVIAGTDLRQVSTFIRQSRTYGFNDRLNTSLVDYNRIFPLYAGLGASTVIPSNNSFSDALDRFVSVYANAAYTYNGLYTISVSARRDASNLLGVNTNDKWNPFWSAGAAWNIFKESFYQSSFLPYLRFRATYGYSGNVPNSLSALTTITYRPASDQPVTNIPYAFISNYPNPNLRWEQVSQVNFAIDFGLKNNIISGTIDYYRKKSKDVLGEELIDPTTGVSAITTNSANIKGSGLELQLNATVVNSSQFKWLARFQFNHVDYKVTRHLRPFAKFEDSIAYVSNGSSIIPIEGYTPYLVVSYRWAGLDPLTGDPRGYVNKQISKDYASIFRTPTREQVIHGSALPLYFGNLLNTFSWKGISLSANISYKFKYFFRRKTIKYGDVFQLATIHSDFNRRWQKPGDELITSVPSMIYPNPSANRDQFYEFSEVTVEKGDHIRLEDIRLSYRPGKTVAGKGPFKQLQFYTYFGNLNALIWKANKAGLDPGNPSGGIRAEKSITFGVVADL